MTICSGTVLWSKVTSRQGCTATSVMKWSPQNSKNGPKGNSFELLSESNDDESITVETTSARGRPLKRTQPFEPNSPPRAKRTNSTKATIPRLASTISSSDEWMQVRDLLTRVETALTSAEQRAEKAEKRIEALEELIRNELCLGLAQLPLPMPLHYYRLLHLHRRLSLLDRFQVLDST
ncbi:hypothetical protein BKA64DRAFT_686811 [Cadophora sp. MPI-SDFR-AT-0126]|nr:hypothetical protein BKA64DRAFT_686811 [Leotiomycetes sp. MPI-SDFR-AT-0126]